MQNQSNPLLEPAKMGALELSNRVVMAPLTRSRAANSEFAPFDIHATYYAQRASAGLIISEGTVVSPQGRGYINTPGIHSRAQVAGWKKVTDVVHAAGGKIVVQLWHVGRISHPDFQGGELPVAPSAIDPQVKVFTENGMTRTVTPRALSVEDIQDIVQNFAQAGANAMEAGFDGVEIHSSNGYLFHQFFSNSSNHRTDAYGGSDANKARFLFEVIEALGEQMPYEKIGLRLNPMMDNASGLVVDAQTAQTFDHIVTRLNDYPLAFLHLSRPWTGTGEGPHIIQDVIGHYRKLYQGFLIANGDYDPESGAAEIAAGRADAIAFGRPFISNPDLVARIRNGWPLAVPDRSTFYTAGPEGYLDYPTYQE